MKTKIIPFDLETAKKIQAGEIVGKITYNNAEVEILDFDVYFDGHTYICVKTNGNIGKYRTKLFTVYGKDPENDLFYDLQLEVPDNEPHFQKRYTTPEQSKKLLDLGVPSDSADMLYDRGEVEIDEQYNAYSIPVNRSFKKYGTEFYIPCWSVGCLLEILQVHSHKGDFEEIIDKLKTSENFVETLVQAFIDYNDNMVYESTTLNETEQ